MPRRALIVIDVQNDYVRGNLPIEYPPVDVSLANIGRAMDAAREAAVPVVAVQNVLPATAPFMAEGTPGADLHETVASRGWDRLIRKNMPGAFSGTDLESWLKERGIGTITIAGYMTHNCDLSTVIQGVHAGLAVEMRLRRHRIPPLPQPGRQRHCRGDPPGHDGGDAVPFRRGHDHRRVDRSGKERDGTGAGHDLHVEPAGA